VNALELITSAYGLSGVVSKGFEEINPDQLEDGILWLNVVTSEKKIRSGAIPFRKAADDEVELKPSVEKYIIPDLVSLSSLTFTDENNLRYGLDSSTYNEYFSSSRLNTTTGLPSNYYAEREDFGMAIYFFPLPNKTYTLQIRGKFGLLRRTMATLNVEYLYEDFFLGLIIFELAKKLALANDEVWSPEKEMERQKVSSQVYNMIGCDLSKRSGSMNTSTTAFAQTMSNGWAVRRI
jgi:hypothetical protein